MKKFLSLLTACLTADALLVGCGGAQSSDNQKSGITTVGMITNLNMSEQKINDVLRSINGVDVHSNFVYYDNLNTLQMALSSDAVDEISIYKTVADYLIARNPELQLDNTNNPALILKDKFFCAIKTDNADLLGEFNFAIADMKHDGTLDALTKKYIVDLKSGEEPEAVELPMVEGHQTLKVAVTGDLPPLDLITADGKPAGFNTAVLAEISKRINKNFELVSVDSAARASSLSSGNVDVIFWVRVPNNNDVFPADIDAPEGISVTDYYFVDESVYVDKK